MQIPDLYKLFLQFPSITTDSRNSSANSLFFALKGERFNGNQFALDALNAGCAYAIVDELTEVIDRRFILVDNCLDTLQQLATYHRKKLGLPVLAITGSNGKTTTKELIANVLTKEYSLIYTQGNLNNHIGVPLTLLRLNRSAEFAIIEMGANHIGEIGALCRIADPDYAIITNIGKAHLEGFGSPEGVKIAKGELYQYAMENEGRIFINWNNPVLKELVEDKKVDLYKYGTGDDCDCIGGIESEEEMLKFGFYHSETGKKYSVSTKLFGRYNFENALCACAIGTFFRIAPEKIVDAIESYEPKNNRSQIIRTERNYIVMDAYNANPTSMRIAIEEFSVNRAKEKVLILGDMFEMGSYSGQEHQAIIDLIDMNSDMECFLVGKDFREVSAGMYKSFIDVIELNGYLDGHPLTGKTILIKGSRGVQLEKCLPFL